MVKPIGFIGWVMAGTYTCRKLHRNDNPMGVMGWRNENVLGILLLMSMHDYFLEEVAVW